MIGSQTFPKTWKLVKCQDVIDVRDGTHDTPAKVTLGIPLITSKNLKPEGIDFSDVTYISEADHQQIEKRSGVDDGDILFAMIGTIGNPVIVRKNRLFSIKNVALFKLGSAQVLPEYFKRLLSSQFVEKQLSRATRGGNQKFVSLQVLRSLIIPLPPIAEQKRIAAILDKAEELRGLRRKALGELDAIVQSIFFEMFGDPATNLKDWAVSKLGDIAKQITDGEHQTPKRTLQGTKLLSARNVQDGYIDVQDVDYIGIEEYERIKKRCNPTRGDILISCSGTIGRVTMVETDEPFSLVRSVALVKPRSNFVCSKFLECFLRTSALRKRMQQRANASSQANLFQNQIRDLPAFIPLLSLSLKRILKPSYSARFLFWQLENDRRAKHLHIAAFRFYSCRCDRRGLFHLFPSNKNLLDGLKRSNDSKPPTVNPLPNLIPSSPPCNTAPFEESCGAS